MLYSSDATETGRVKNSDKAVPSRSKSSHQLVRLRRSYSSNYSARKIDHGMPELS